MNGQTGSAGTPALAGPRFQAGFEGLPGHRSLVVRWHPVGLARARALFIPAFGDEMNQSRRMVRLAAEALAGQGVGSTIFDLHGTGDSSAEFEDATVSHWLTDCVAMAEREQRQSGLPLLLIGCRLGAALAVRASELLPHPVAALIAWAPVLEGRMQLSTLLRADKLGRMQRNDASDSPDPRASWAAGQPAWLGGYPVSAALAGELESLDGGSAPRAARASLIDLRLAPNGEVVRPGSALVDRGVGWSRAGVPTEVQAVAGAVFWNVVDLVDAPELIEATVDVAVRACEAGR